MLLVRDDVLTLAATDADSRRDVRLPGFEVRLTRFAGGPDRAISIRWGTDGVAAAFALSDTGSLDEYVYYPNLPPLFAPYAQLHVTNFADSLIASQIEKDTVFYGEGGPLGALGSELFEHSPNGNTLDYVLLG